ncbi:MAG: hypothetical protein ACR2HJ_08805 [Fimbriimonadales bacterium]
MICLSILALTATLAPNVWPNSISKANSDPWLIENHDRIIRMQPRLLVLNFANGLSRENARSQVNKLIAALSESSRYHGYKKADAPAFLEYKIHKFIDLADSEKTVDGNSAQYPRVPNWTEGINFQYSRLFTNEFTRQYDIDDPSNRSRDLSLSELVNRGIINEVWFLAYHGKYGSPFESIEVKQVYDEQFRKVKGKSVQAGNGGDEGQPFIGRSLRILFINVERGTGCAMESLGHSFEGMSNSRAIPYFTKYFREYAGFDLDKEYGLPFDSLYARNGNEMNYPSPTTMSFTWEGAQRSVTNYVVAGGNVHFPPNGRRDYDTDNMQPVMSTIEHYRMHDDNGKDKATLWTPKVFDRYRKLAPDCMGAWVVYWRQNMPGYRNKAKDDAGNPMKNWWPFLFY